MCMSMCAKCSPNAALGAPELAKPAWGRPEVKCASGRAGACRERLAGCLFNCWCLCLVVVVVVVVAVAVAVQPAELALEMSRAPNYHVIGANFMLLLLPPPLLLSSGQAGAYSSSIRLSGRLETSSCKCKC